MKASENAKKAADEADKQAIIAAQKKIYAEQAEATAKKAKTNAETANTVAAAFAKAAATASDSAVATVDAIHVENEVLDVERYVSEDVEELVKTANEAAAAATKAAAEAKAAASSAVKAANEAAAADIANTAAAFIASVIKAANEADSQAIIAAKKKEEVAEQVKIAITAVKEIKKKYEELNLSSDELNTIVGQLPNDIAERSLDLLNRHGKFREIILNGGGDDVDKTKLIEFNNLINKINYSGNIFNTNVIIHLTSLMSYDTYFNNVWENISTHNKIKIKFINLFFIDVTQCSQIINILKFNNNNIYNIIFRDTYIYTQYNNENKNLKLFIVNAFKLLYNYCKTNNITTIFLPHPKSKELVILIHQIINNLNNIYSIEKKNKKTQYDIIFEHKVSIENEFKKLFKDKSNVSTYLNVRVDDFINPRFELSNNITKTELTNFNLEIDYYNTDTKINNKTDRKDDNREKYVFGPFNYIFKDKTNKEIAKKIYDDLLDKIKNKEPLFFIGYGQSGSGKTSNLIYLDNINTQKKEPGIIQYFCNLFIENTNFNYTKLTLNIRNLYVYFGNNANNMDMYKSEFTKIDYIPINSIDSIPTEDNTTINFTVKNTNWISQNEKDLGQYIMNALNLRNTEPTTNNIISSRSHILLFLTLSSDDNKSVQQICIGDFAGVENNFDCDRLIKDFNISYENSNKYKDKPIPLDNYVVEQEKLKPGFFKSNNFDKKKHTEYIDRFRNINISVTNLKCDENNRLESYDTNKTAEENIANLNEKLSKIKKIDDNLYLINIYIFERFLDVLPTISKKWSDGITLQKIPFFNYRLNSMDKYRSNCKGIDKKDLENIIENLKILFKQDFFNHRLSNLTLKDLYESDNDKLSIFKKLLNDIFISIVKQVEDSKTKKGDDIVFDKSNLSNNFTLRNYSNVSTYFQDNNNLLKNIVNTHIIDYIQFKNKTNNDINKLECIIANINKIRYNCNLRNDEGYMINKTLKDLRMDIENIVKNSIIIEKKENIIKIIRDLKFTDNTPLDISDDIKIFPLTIDNNIHPYCRNMNIFNSNPYKYNNFTEEITDSSNIIQELINHKFDLKKLNFVIFTVINVSSTVNGIQINNPPNPPYIQLNDLKTAIINDNNQEIIKNANNLLIVLDNYNFYKTLNYNYNNDYGKDLDNLKNFFISNDTDEFTKIKIAKFLTNLIENNNASTLIGTLYATDLLKNITEYNFPCVVKNTELNINTKLRLEKIYQFDYNQLGGYKNKYLKYKIKYLELKQKLKIKL